MADDLHEMSIIIFFGGKKKKKLFENVCCSCNWLLGLSAVVIALKGINPLSASNRQQFKFYIFFFYFQKKTRVDFSCESSTGQKKDQKVVCCSCDWSFKG